MLQKCVTSPKASNHLRHLLLNTSAIPLAQVHGRVFGGRQLKDIHTFNPKHKEAEKERFLNMVRTPLAKLIA